MENIWIYEVWGESWGIVKANNKKEAEKRRENLSELQWMS